MTNINSDNNQSLPNTISSGDDHLLTADADDKHFRYMNHEYKNYHDNRAFQYHNNNSLPKSKAKIIHPHNNDELDVVIIQQRKSIKAESGNSMVNKKDSSGGIRATCRRHTRTKATRQRHNATQTADSGMGWKSHSNCSIHGYRTCHGISTNTICCNKNTNNCCSVSTAKTEHKGIVNNEVPTEVTCHCHITHHCHHHYSPISGSAVMTDGGKDNDYKTQTTQRRRELRSKRKNCERLKRPSMQHKHRHNHHQQHSNQQDHHLPIYIPNTKSSFESSDEHIDHCPAQYGRHNSSKRNEIAIEIDAATMTEGNTSTATSNFAYKMAADNAAPIIMVPVHTEMRKHRRSSLNSNTTIETDELSHNDEQILTNADVCNIANKSSTTTPRAICCNDKNYCCNIVPASQTNNGSHAQNECVKIKRKRFIQSAKLNSNSSHCSCCSSCSCQQDRTSSCSSIDDFATDDVQPHEFTVSADCHHCNIQRQSSASTIDDYDAVSLSKELQISSMQRGAQDQTTDSSARTSRRSSATFCSCNSANCCYCSCSCDECETGQMCTARDETFTNTDKITSHMPTEYDDPHSSTLTPVTTNPSSLVSTPHADDADVTIRSLSNVLGEPDASSLSQSAEYFSLSSCNQSSQQATPNHTATAPVIKTTSTAATSRKTCKHYSKHHRHKRDSPPIDSYL